MKRMVRQGCRCNLEQETLTLGINITESKQTLVLTPVQLMACFLFLKKSKLLFGIISGLTEKFQRN